MKNVYEITITSDFDDTITYYVSGRRLFRTKNDGGLERAIGLNQNNFYHNFIKGGQIYISALQGEELRETREKISKAK